MSFRPLKNGIISKVVISGRVVNVYEYSIPFKTGSCVKAQYKTSSVISDDKRNDNLYRCRKNVRELIWCNTTEHSKLLTLTTRYTVLDYDDMHYMLKQFFKGMSRDGYKLKFLYVLENQKERGERESNQGSLHAHIVIFNDEKIPLDVIKKNWSKYGSENIQLLKGLKDKNNIKVESAAAYICKYITKENLTIKNSKGYSCSRCLKKPKIIDVNCHYDDGIIQVAENNDLIVPNVLDMIDVNYSNDEVTEFTVTDGMNITRICRHTQGILKEGITL